MKTLEQQVIKRLSDQVGAQSVVIYELEARLVQALQTISALEKEMEGNVDGNSEQECEAANGTADCNE